MSSIPDLYLWMVCIGLTLVVLSLCWQIVRTADAKGRLDDPLPRITHRSEQVRKAMTPDEVPIPGRDGIEDVQIDSLWKRRN